MAQISYGTITITDTNDVESITVEYARNDSSVIAPTTGWSTARPTWEEGKFIWQRTRIHKSGTSVEDDSYGAAVCLTGSSGATGRSLLSTETRFTNAIQNATKDWVIQTTEQWLEDVPPYDADKPDYWVRIKNTFDTAPLEELTYYKDSGITDAMATAAAADQTAKEASSKAKQALDKVDELDEHLTTYIDANEVEINALKSRTKYIWINLQNSAYPKGTYAASGISGTTFNEADSSTYGYNTYLSNNSLNLRYNAINYTGLTTTKLTFFYPKINDETPVQGETAVTLSADGLKLYNRYTGTGSADTDANLSARLAVELNTSGLIIKKGSVIIGTTSGTTAGNVTLSDTNFIRSINGTSRDSLRLAIGSNFGVKNDGTLYASNAIISGQITVGGGSTIDPTVTVDGTALSTIASNAANGNTANNKQIVFRGISSTGASEATKIVNCMGWTLTNGAMISITWAGSSSLTTGQVSLNVNGTGEKPVYIQGVITSDTNRLQWLYGASITFRYNSSGYYEVTDQPPTYYGETCTVAEGTAAKTSVVNQAVIFKGTTVEIPMTYANSATAPTLGLKEGSTTTTASFIYYGTSTTAPTKTNGFSWLAGTTVRMVYDGKFWRMGGKTYIDGGNILTDTVTADQIKVNSLSALSANMGTLTSGIITTNSARTTYNATTQGFTLTTSGIGAGNGTYNTFYVNTNGYLYSRSGSIGGWSIGVDSISKASTVTSGTASTQYQTLLYAPTVSSTSYAMYVRHRSYDGSAYGSWTNNFLIRYDGYVYARNAEITGKITTSNITATGGTIGKYTITSSYLYTGSGSTQAGMGGDQAFWAGSSTSNSAPFRVSYGGALVSTSATITGVLTANANSKIGPWTVGSSAIYNTKTSLTDANEGVWLGSDGIALGKSSVFKVTKAGVLTATGVTISGTVTATALKTGTKTAYNSGNGTYIDSSGNIYVGNGSTNNFTVTAAGAITANSGKVGGWSITSGALEAGATTASNTYYRCGIQPVSQGIDEGASAFYAGCTTQPGNTVADPTKTNFYVTHSGRMFCKDIQVGVSTNGYISYTTFTSTSNVAKSSWRPSINGRSDLGSSSYKWDYLYVNNVQATTVNATTFNGALSGNATTATTATTATNVSGGSVSCTSVTTSGHVNLPNNTSLQAKNSSGTYKALLYASSSNNIQLGDEGWADCYIHRVYTSTTGTVSSAPNVYISSGHRLVRTTHANSSLRFKHDIKDVEDKTLDAHNLYNIEFKQFKYNDDIITDKNDHRYGKTLSGFIAEQVYEHYPIAVDINENGECEAWSPQYIVPPMLALVQEQHKDIEQLKSEIQELKSEIQELKQLIK